MSLNWSASASSSSPVLTEMRCSRLPLPICAAPWRNCWIGMIILRARNMADVGMRDQPAAAVDREGLAFLADLDLRHHLPDELEIHLGDADAGVAARAGHGKRHVGLGLAAEVDRAVIDLLRHRFGEL